MPSLLFDSSSYRVVVSSGDEYTCFFQRQKNTTIADGSLLLLSSRIPADWSIRLIEAVLACQSFVVVLIGSDDVDDDGDDDIEKLAIYSKSRKS
jgi:hypothetical protein